MKSILTVIFLSFITILNAQGPSRGSARRWLENESKRVRLPKNSPFKLGPNFSKNFIILKGFKNENDLNTYYNNFKKGQIEETIEASIIFEDEDRWSSENPRQFMFNSKDILSNYFLIINSRSFYPYYYTKVNKIFYSENPNAPVPENLKNNPKIIYASKDKIFIGKDLSILFDVIKLDEAILRAGQVVGDDYSPTLETVRNINALLHKVGCSPKVKNSPWSKKFVNSPLCLKLKKVQRIGISQLCHNNSGKAEGQQNQKQQQIIQYKEQVKRYHAQRFIELVKENHIKLLANLGFYKKRKRWVKRLYHYSSGSLSKRMANKLIGTTMPARLANLKMKYTSETAYGPGFYVASEFLSTIDYADNNNPGLYVVTIPINRIEKENLSRMQEDFGLDDYFDTTRKQIENEIKLKFKLKINQERAQLACGNIAPIKKVEELKFSDIENKAKKEMLSLLKSDPSDKIISMNCGTGVSVWCAINEVKSDFDLEHVGGKRDLYPLERQLMLDSDIPRWLRKKIK